MSSTLQLSSVGSRAVAKDIPFGAMMDMCRLRLRLRLFGGKEIKPIVEGREINKDGIRGESPLFFFDSPERFRPERIRIQRGMRANERNPLFPVVLGIPPGPLERERKKSMTTWGGGEVEFGVNNNKASRGLTLNSAGSGQIGAHARRQSIVLGRKSTQCSWLFKLMTGRNYL